MRKGTRGYRWDHDRGLAAETRERLFDGAEDEDLLVAGGHLPYPDTGRLVRVANWRVYEAVTLTPSQAAG